MLSGSSEICALRIPSSMNKGSGTVIDNFPITCLIAISTALAALRNNWFPGSRKMDQAVADMRGSFDFDQMNT